MRINAASITANRLLWMNVSLWLQSKAASGLVIGSAPPNYLSFLNLIRYRIIKCKGTNKVSGKKKVPLYFGPIPAGAIKNALDIDVEDGDAVMSFNAQKHARNRHPTDYARCLPHVAAVVNAPLYARDDFKNKGKIELVGRPSGMSEYLLVAVELTLDTQGRYNVTSFYPISEKKVQARRESGHLVRVVLI